MTVCKFWLQGNCRHGDQCRFEHPPGRGAAQPAQAQNNYSRQPQDQNRFVGAGRGNQNYASNNQRGGPGPRDSRDNRNSRDPRPYGVTREMLQEDLLQERPMWIMSGYGPGKEADIQLFGGFPLEQSPEEIRTLHYQAVASGNLQQSAQMEAELAAKSNEQVQAVLNDPSGALKYLENGAKEHPNRNDICKANTSQLQRNGNGPFSRSTRQAQQQKSQRQGFNQPATSGFQQQPQQQQHPGFGQSPPIQQNMGFGVPKPAPAVGFGGVPQTGFGQSPQPPQPEPTAFGVNPPNAFASQPTPAGFGVPAAPPNNQPFGANAFGQPNMNAPFAQPQQLQQQQPPANNSPFGQPAIQQPMNAFANIPQQPQQQNPSPFGTQPNQPAPPQQQPGNLFGQPQSAAPQIMTNGFQQPAQPFLQQQPQQQQMQQQQQPQQPSGFGMGMGMANSNNALLPAAANGDVNSYTTRDASNKLLTWKGRPVNYINDIPCYRRDDDNAAWERIWFPDGEPASAAAADGGGGGGGDAPGAPGADAMYPAPVREAYTVLRDTGQFRDGLVPDMPPSAGMVRWDF